MNKPSCKALLEWVMDCGGFDFQAEAPILDGQGQLDRQAVIVASYREDQKRQRETRALSRKFAREVGI